MKIIRVGALNPPSSERSSWTRKLLTMAVEQDLAPLILPSHDLTSYTVSMPPALAERILQAADQAKMSPTDYTAGLIAAAQSGKPDSKAEVIESAPALLAGETRVREILRPLMRKAREEMSGGKVVFMEAATGSNSRGESRWHSPCARAAQFHLPCRSPGVGPGQRRERPYRMDQWRRKAHLCQSALCEQDQRLTVVLADGRCHEPC